ncbi:MAG TPA: hypothetical protein VGY66_04790 [Gemmataceae bacterium]|nr:hypothetical protein [Gemmataceae bacterium]
MQCSLGRRAPTTKSIPLLETARDGLRRLLEKDRTNAEAWQLLSQAEECLLNYQEAITSLEQAKRLNGSRTKKDLKRLALLKESCGYWQDFPLSADQLRKLGHYLVGAGAEEEQRGRTFTFTRRWLAENKVPEPDAVIQALEKRGAFSDFQVLYNVVRG